MRIFIKLLLVLLACFLEFVAYIAIATLLGWTHGGGVVPMIILFAIWGATFRIIIYWGTTKEQQPDPDQTEDK